MSSNTPADIIYLQVEDLEGNIIEHEYWDELTWCNDQINPTDKCYISKDLYDALKASHDILVEHHSVTHHPETSNAAKNKSKSET